MTDFKCNPRMGLVHAGECGCPAGKPVIVDPITQTVFLCAACFARVYRATAAPDVWPLEIDAGNPTVPVKTMLMECSGRALSLAGLIGEGGVLESRPAAPGSQARYFEVVRVGAGASLLRS